MRPLSGLAFNRQSVLFVQLPLRSTGPPHAAAVAGRAHTTVRATTADAAVVDFITLLLVIRVLPRCRSSRSSIVGDLGREHCPVGLAPPTQRRTSPPVVL